MTGTDPAGGSRPAARRVVRDLDELAALLCVPLDALLALVGEAPQGFPLRVPRGFVARMQPGRLDDPLLRQVLPLRAESSSTDGFGADPLEERTVTAHGVVKKYAGRALLVTTGACPVHCRYCFRREFPYSEQLAARNDWQPALAALTEHGDVREVILSGGDPLSLSNARLEALLRSLRDVPTLDTVRIHTRYPIVAPERVDAELESLLDDVAHRLVVVVHCNHAQEIDDHVATALARLRKHTDLLLNQAVLLAGVNDDVDVLEALSRRLFACDTLPYYLHMLDKVTGTAHFEVDDARARDLVRALAARLPGYLVPKLVREVPGDLSKTPL